jgi:hypothetical protein
MPNSPPRLTQDAGDRDGADHASSLRPTAQAPSPPATRATVHSRAGVAGRGGPALAAPPAPRPRTALPAEVRICELIRSPRRQVGGLGTAVATAGASGSSLRYASAAPRSVPDQLPRDPRPRSQRVPRASDPGRPCRYLAGLAPGADIDHCYAPFAPSPWTPSSTRFVTLSPDIPASATPGSARRPSKATPGSRPRPSRARTVSDRWCAPGGSVRPVRFSAPRCSLQSPRAVWSADGILGLQAFLPAEVTGRIPGLRLRT